jgi:hypothetical protein
MFAKQAQIAVAALAFAVAGSAFAQQASADRNVFDSEAALQAPAAKSAAGLTREQVRAEFLAARAAGDLNVFDNETTAYVKPSLERSAHTRLAQAGK